MYIAAESVANIKAAAQIQEVLGDYLELKQTGQNYWACCPFHEEKTPSFSIAPEAGYYKCFGCGVKGDLFHFLMEHKGISYKESLEYVAKKYQIPVRYVSTGKEISRYTPAEKAILNTLGKVLDYYQEQLKQTPVARAYLTERGISEKIQRLFGLGFAPDGWTHLLQYAQKKGISERMLLESGLAIEKDTRFYDRYRNRLLFPLFDTQGDLIGFAGRTLDHTSKQAKYINPPESRFYKKSHYLYGLYQAKKAIRQHKQIIVVEGYMDLLALYQVGIEHVVALSGTAMTNEQAALMRRFSPEVTFCLDGDSAGLEATLRAVFLALKAGLKVRLIQLQEGNDPDSIRQQLGADGLLKQIQTGATDWLEGIYQILIRKYPNNDAPGVQQTIAEKLLQAISLLNDPLEQAIYLERAAGLLKLPLEPLKAYLKQWARSQQETRALAAPIPEGGAYPPVKQPLSGDEAYASQIRAERNILQLLLRYGHIELPDKTPLAHYIFEQMETLTFTDRLYENIFKAFQGAWKKKTIAGGKDFLNQMHSPSDQALLIDLIDFPYSTKGWAGRKKQLVPSEEDHLPLALEKGILYMKLAVLKRMLSDNYQQLLNAHTAKEQNERIAFHQQLKGQFKEIGTHLGMTLTG